jgi:hypothetical protein
MRCVGALIFPAVVLGLMFLAIVAGVPFEYATMTVLLLSLLTLVLTSLCLIIRGFVEWLGKRRQLVNQRPGFSVLVPPAFDARQLPPSETVQQNAESGRPIPGLH